MKLAEKLLEQLNGSKDFLSYFKTFYSSSKANYRDTFKPPLSDSELLTRFKEFEKFRGNAFQGDSIDREFFRDYILYKRGVKNTEWDVDYLIKYNKGQILR